MSELCKAEKNPLGLHVVAEGETLVSLCEKYSVSESELIRQPGETLSSVCEKFGMSEEEFASRNGETFLYPMRRVLVKE